MGDADHAEADRIGASLPAPTGRSESDHKPVVVVGRTRLEGSRIITEHYIHLIALHNQK